LRAIITAALFVAADRREILIYIISSISAMVVAMRTVSCILLDAAANCLIRHYGSERVWDAATGTLLTRVLEHRDAVRRAVFSPGGVRA